MIKDVTLRYRKVMSIKYYIGDDVNFNNDPI